MFSFFDFIKNTALREVFKASLAKKVRKQIRKKAGYKPGTFGFELEFPAERNDDVTSKDLNNPFVPNDVKYNYGAIQRILERIIQKHGEHVGGENSTESSWGVGVDHQNVELRSRYLTTQDFPLILSIINDINKNNDLVTDSGCSAHVHIGLQQFDEMNAFDALATLFLIDEDEAYEVAGPWRETRFARSKDEVMREILNSLLRSGIIHRNGNQSELESIVTDSKFKSILDFSVDGLGSLGKFGGTNLKSLITHETIEFRYLSSEVLLRPKDFLSMIQYYLMLPFLARRKMQIKFWNSNFGYIYFTRETGNRIKISYKAASYPFGGIDSTREKLPPTVTQRLKSMQNQRLVNYFKDITVGELYEYLYNFLKDHDLIEDLKKYLKQFGNSSDIRGDGYNFCKNLAARKNIYDRDVISTMFVGLNMLNKKSFVEAYASKKLNDVFFFDYPKTGTKDRELLQQPFDSQLTSLGLIVGNNWSENFERLYKFLYKIKAFG